jgi:tetratricopeptide (TPR) repeat protein
MRNGAIAVAGLSVLLNACASFRGQGRSERQRELQFEPVVITGDLELEKLNDEELFASGSSAFAAGDYAQAARYFDRLVDFHPHSKHLRVAAYKAGLAHEKLSDWEKALTRFRQLADPEKGKGDALEASFRWAEVLYHSGRYAEAVQVLSTIGRRTDLSVSERMQASVHRGICELEAGRSEAAETILRKALADYEALADKSEVDDYYPSQAQFFLGEVYRLHYESTSLDPSKGVDQLAQELEYKAELLLSAQGHYLRTIRMGNGYWATAAGARIGGLYESLYEHMVSSPAPKELNEEEAAVYRQELRKRIRILVIKAITMYERTLETAQRIGASNPFVEKTRESLQKMKELLLADAQRDDQQSPNTN